MSPSFILHLPKSKIGLDIGYSNRKEEISYKQIAIDNPDPTYFMFKGMGFYNYETAVNKFRFQEENNYWFGLQYATSIFGYQALTEVRGSHTIEEIEDGSTTIKKEDAGDWITYKLKLNQQLTKQNSNFIKKITIDGSFFQGNGIEYTQELILNENKMSEYKTLFRNLFFKRETIVAKLKFDYLKLISDNKIDWEVSAFANFEMNNEKYYYIPEKFKADYSNLNMNVSFQKNFYMGDFHIAPEIQAKYRFNLSNEINLFNNEDIRQYTKIYTHDFDYYTQDMFNISAFINLGYKTALIDSIDQLFLKIGYEYWSISKNNTSGAFLVKAGFMF